MSLAEAEETSVANSQEETTQNASSLESKEASVEDGEHTKEKDNTEPKPPADQPFPDGGLRAWLVVLGAVCGNAGSFGLINSWGVFQAYYETDVLRGVSPSSIAWIGSIQYALVYLPALLVGRMFDLGYHKIPLFIASVVFVLATFLIAECTEYWHFLLCQGFTIGLSTGVIFGPLSAIISHWFKQRLGLVLGILALGSSIIGTIFPIVIRNLIPAIGFKWTIRVIAFIEIVILGVANLAISRRLPPVRRPGGLFNLQAFKYLPYTLYCASGLTAFLGIYTLLTYIDISATKVGVNPNFAFYLVSIVNAASGVARVTFGKLSDRAGALNLLIPMTAIVSIITFAWPFATDKGSLIGIAIPYGLSSGTYISLSNLPIMLMGDSGDVGRRLGMFMSIVSIGALTGPPISGAINGATDGYQAVGYYAGSILLVSVTFMTVVRFMLLGRLRGKI